MDKRKKIVLIAVAATSIAGSAVIGASALAATSSSGSTKYPNIIEKIAQKFNLNPADVNAVFQQEKQDRAANKDAKLKTLLDKAVSSGKITAAQESQIISEVDSLRGQLKQDRQSDRQNIRNQLQQWLNSNNINIKLPAFGAGKHSITPTAT